ncbi:MAG: hypothetical protein A2Y23_00590 [Clostridiales bacterium GWB2_37_7]|nr:MAG: hypothetical protein A2Y23_00590 [Clostridiales bacterium GWB2_37_7]
MQDFKSPIDRRQKSDGIIKLVTFISTIGWILIIICAILVIYARPDQPNMFYKMFNVSTRDYWNYSLLNIMFILLIFLFVLSLIGIMMNAMRQRRKTDKINKSLIFQAIMSLVGMILLWVNSLIG